MPSFFPLPVALNSRLSFFGPGSGRNTVLGAFLAMLLGFYFARQVSAYPRVTSKSAIFPAFSIAFGLMLATFFFWRIDYSRFLFGSSFVLVLAWFGFVALIEPGLRRQRFFVVPYGQAETLVASKSADWVLGDSPEDLPSGFTGIALTQLAEAVDWVFRLDADEVVSNQLAGEIATKLPHVSSEVSGIVVTRALVFQRRRIRHGGLYPIRVLRLFRKGRGFCEKRWMDEHIVVSGATTDVQRQLS